MQCVYRAYEHDRQGTVATYLERDGGLPFFVENTAIIKPHIKPTDDGYLYGYELTTLRGETVGLERFTTKVQCEHKAMKRAIEAGQYVAMRYDSRVHCLVDGKTAGDVIKRLDTKINAKEEEENAE